MLISKLLCVLGDDACNMSNYMRSSSPEYNEVVLMDSSDEDDREEGEEFSEEIPVIAECPKFPSQDKDVGAVMFDDSESVEFSLLHVNWSHIDKLLPSESTDEDPTVVSDTADSDDGGPRLSAESEITSQCEVGSSRGRRLPVSEVDRSASEGLVFDISCVAGLDQDTTLKSAEESPVPSASRLSRKRSRASKDDCEERVQFKQLRHSVDVPTEFRNIAEPAFQRPQQVNAGSADGDLLPSYNSFLTESSNEELRSETSSLATETPSGSCTPIIFSQSCDTSFSQGTS